MSLRRSGDWPKIAEPPSSPSLCAANGPAWSTLESASATMVTRRIDLDALRMA
jgi:hypothetical protein